MDYMIKFVKAMEIEVGYFEREEIGRVRTHQEDSHGQALGTPNGDVFVMCDGMGGHVGGKQASSMAVDCILDYLQKEEYQDKQRGLVDAIQFANKQILGYADEYPEFTGMGTTVCVLLIKGDEVFIAHVGDSRIYLYLGKEQQLHRITKDHSYVQTLVDAGKITDDEAEHHPQKNRILKALGGNLQVTPDVNMDPIKPKKGDIFLLCSDGLSGMIQDGVMESVLSQETGLNQKGNQLVDIALNNGGVDNITAQLVEVTSSPYKRSMFKSFNPKGRPQATEASLGSRPPQNRWKIVKLVSMILCAVLLISILVWKMLPEEKKKDIEDVIKRPEKNELKNNCQQLDSINGVLNNRITTLNDSITTLNDSIKNKNELIKELKIELDEWKKAEEYAQSSLDSKERKK